MDEFVRKLRINVPAISREDAARIMAVASARERESLNDVAEQFFISRPALSYALVKLYRSAAVPGINNLSAGQLVRTPVQATKSPTPPHRDILGPRIQDSSYCCNQLTLSATCSNWFNRAFTPSPMR